MQGQYLERSRIFSAILSACEERAESEEDSERYIVRGTDWAQDEPDTISRPEVFDTETGESLGGRWALNDWDRAEAFARELNESE